MLLLEITAKGLLCECTLHISELNCDDKKKHNALSSLNASAFSSHGCVNNAVKAKNTTDDTLQQLQLCIQLFCVFADLFCHIMHFNVALPLRGARILVGKG